MTSKKFLFLLLTGLLLSGSISNGNAVFANEENKKTEKIEKKKNESSATKRLAIELEKLIEARESVDKIFIQIDRVDSSDLKNTKATVLLQSEKDKEISAEEMKKIKLLISTAVEGLEESNISIVNIDFSNLQRKFASKDNNKSEKTKKERKEKKEADEKSEKTKKDDKKETKTEEKK